MSLINSISTYACVYCLDMPGFGDSQEPNMSWNVDSYVRFINSFIKKQNINELDLIGHSNGGRIIIKLMNMKNLDFKVDKIVLLGSAGILHKKTIFQKLKIKIYKCFKKLLKINFINLLFPNLLTRLKNLFGSADYKNATPIMRETLVKLVNENLQDLLSNISAPTLLIWGTNDSATPIHDGEIMEKLIPNSGLIKIEHGSHYVFLEHPGYVNFIIKTFFNGGN